MKLIELTKVCKKCGKRKNWLNFDKSKRGKFGVRIVCTKCRKIWYKAWRKVNKERLRIVDKIRYKKRKKRIKKYNRTYYINNKVKISKNVKIYEKNKIKTDPKFRLKKNISKLIRLQLNGNKNGLLTKNLLGYSIDILKKHLEKQFTEGMTWELFLEGKIHIDHKIPVSVFNFTKPEHEDFKRCWALSNLQPMWAIENMSKGAKLTKHFQPSLLL